MQFLPESPKMGVVALKPEQEGKLCFAIGSGSAKDVSAAVRLLDGDKEVKKSDCAKVNLDAAAKRAEATLLFPEPGRYRVPFWADGNCVLRYEVVVL